MRQEPFRKGNISWNCGMHPREWMDEEGYKRFQSTQFKKGEHASPAEFKKDNIPWNKQLKGIHCSQKTEFKSKQVKELWRDTSYRSKMKKRHGYLGKHHTKETIKKIRIANLGKKKSEETRRKLSIRNMGQQNPMWGKHRKFSDAHLRNILKGLLRRPTKLEQKFMRIIEKNRLLFKYVGDGKIIINGKCPDFIDCDGSKRVVEVFGRVWHDPKMSFKEIPYHQTEQGTIEHYSKYGFKCTVLWDNEFGNEELVLAKLRGGED